MRRVIVTGAESTGTRFMCRVIFEAGGEAIHSVLPQTVKLHTDRPKWKPILPEGKTADAAVVMFRDLLSTVGSQVRRHVADDQQALAHIRGAYVRAMAELEQLGIPWFPVTYESLARPAAMRFLLEQLRLPGEPQEQWQDANAKWYGEGDFERGGFAVPPFTASPDDLRSVRHKT